MGWRDVRGKYTLKLSSAVKLQEFGCKSWLKKLMQAGLAAFKSLSCSAQVQLSGRDRPRAASTARACASSQSLCRIPARHRRLQAPCAKSCLHSVSWEELGWHCGTKAPRVCHSSIQATLPPHTRACSTRILPSPALEEQGEPSIPLLFHPKVGLGVNGLRTAQSSAASVPRG